MGGLAAGGGISSALGTVANLLSSKMLMKYQYRLNRKLRRRGYQDTMFSMREAGLNPILAYRTGVTGANVGLSQSPNFGQIAEGFTKGAQAEAAKEQAGSARGVRAVQEQTLKSQGRQAEAMAAESAARAVGLGFDNEINAVRAAWSRTEAGKAAIHGKMVGGGPIGTAAGVALDMAVESLKGPPKSPYVHKEPIVIHSNPGGKPGGKK